MSENGTNGKPALITPLFALGQVVATPGALDLLKEKEVDFMTLVKRHVSGDWGVLDPADVKENELSIKKGFRILSNYPLTEPDQDRIWIITEADRSCTTLLLPDEY